MKNHGIHVPPSLRQVDKHRDHLINYIIFLRITPFLPNWFINITSPVINVPLGVFFLGTFFGKSKHDVSSSNTVMQIYINIWLDCRSDMRCWLPVLLLSRVRSRPTIVCGYQRWHNSVQTDHSRGSSVLELSSSAGRAGCALHPACLLPEEAAAEARVGHTGQLSTSSTCLIPLPHSLGSGMVHAAVTHTHDSFRLSLTRPLGCRGNLISPNGPAITSVSHVLATSRMCSTNWLLLRLMIGVSQFVLVHLLSDLAVTKTSGACLFWNCLNYLFSTLLFDVLFRVFGVSSILKIIELWHKSNISQSSCLKVVFPMKVFAVGSFIH